VTVIVTLYLETTVTNQNLINEGIKNRFNLGNACNNWVQNLLRFLLSKKANIKIKTTIILYWCCMVWYGLNSSGTGQGPLVGSF
jgi:hypothetical protein